MYSGLLFSKHLFVVSTQFSCNFWLEVGRQVGAKQPKFASTNARCDLIDTIHT